jgi:hypothetical protein
MNGYKREVLLRYVGFLMVVSWVVAIGGLLWAVGVGVGGTMLRVEDSAPMAGIGLVAAFSGLLYALGIAVAIQVVAQLIRCFVRIEEHLESIATESNLNLARGKSAAD